MNITRTITEVDKFILFNRELYYLSKGLLISNERIVLDKSPFFGTIYNDCDNYIILQSFYGSFTIFESDQSNFEIDGFYQNQMMNEESIFYKNGSNELDQHIIKRRLDNPKELTNLFLFKNLFVALENDTIIQVYIGSERISKLDTDKLDRRGVDEKLKISEISGVYNNTLVCSMTSGGILLIEVETGQPKQFFQDAKVRGGVFQVSEGSPIFHGLKHYTFVEINAESGELVRQVDIKHELKRVANIPNESPCWLTVGTSVYHDGLFYFYGDKNFLGVFDPKQEKIIDYHWFQFDKKGTQLKGGVENLQVNKDQIYCLDTDNTLHVLNM